MTYHEQIDAIIKHRNGAFAMLHYSKFLRDNAMTNHSSPTCVVTFADKQVTRMTVWSADGEPALRRGIHLAWAAYESRTKRFPPAITALHFEVRDGATVLTTTQFTAEQIAEATDDR